MTDQRELDRLLGAFFVDGTDELADRVIDAALDQIHHTRQRRAMRMPRRFSTMNTVTRLAAAAVIGVLAVGGTLYLIRPSQPSVGGPATPGASASPSQPTTTPSPTPSPKPDPMALTGPLGAGRQIHTATLLADGRVIVAGGLDFADLPLASVTHYDPTTGTFTATGSMATARGFHTATLMADGRVLIAGGDPGAWTSSDRLATAELYDPKTGKFAATGSMATARGFHTATLLADGRVLIAGGDGDYPKPNFIASAELYDPKTGTFTATGSMAEARTWGAASLLADGRVLVTGGYGALAPLPSAEIYDPKTGTFSPAGSGG
jgi:hypothetical protein